MWPPARPMILAGGRYETWNWAPHLSTSRFRTCDALREGRSINGNVGAAGNHIVSELHPLGSLLAIARPIARYSRGER